MRKTRSEAALAAITALFLLLAGCDSFSLLEQFRKTSAPELVLTVQKSSLQQGETIELYPSGGTPPYSFGVVEGDLYYHGTLGSIASQSYTAGTSIGTIELHLTDATGESADATVTVIPPAPTLVSVVGDPSIATKAITVTWSYPSVDMSFISGFQVERSTDQTTYTVLPTPSGGSSATSYLDQGGLTPNIDYYYRVRAASGTYLSLPSSVGTAQP